MKKLYFFTVLFFACIVCNAQTYYWSGGKKIWLDTDSTQIIAKFDKEQNLKGFISKNSSSTELPTSSSLVVVQKQSSTDNETFLKLSAEKSIVSKTFAKKYHNSETPYYVTGDILLKTKEGISVENILDKFKIDGQIVKRWLSGGVVIRLNNWDNIMDIANTIYESGMVEWCHPDFATIIERSTTDPMFNQQYYLKIPDKMEGSTELT